MYFPCLVFPYQRVPGLWYTPESIFTHTMPLALARGDCCDAAGLEAGAEFALLAGATGLLAGAMETAGAASIAAAADYAGAGAGVEAAGAVAGVAAAAVEADFFERFFFGGTALASTAGAPAAGVLLAAGAAD